MTDVIDDLGQDFGQLGALLQRLAERGEGTVLGLVPAGRAGIGRVSRALVEEFENRLVQAYRDRTPMLVGYAARKTGDHGRAEDVVQQAFVKILQRYQRDRPEITNLDAYLFTSVRNEVNRELRSIIPDRQALVGEPSPGGEPASPDPDPSTQVADALAIQTALRALPQREREAVVLRVQCQLSVAETAAFMGVTAGAVKRYTSDGLGKLKDRLSR